MDIKIKSNQKCINCIKNHICNLVKFECEIPLIISKITTLFHKCIFKMQWNNVIWNDIEIYLIIVLVLISIPFALKIMHTGNNNFENFKGFIAEYEKLTSLKHPNIVQAYGIFMSDQKTPPSILLELCPRDLTSLIKTHSYKNSEISIWIYQIAEGMKYVHMKKIVHRDLKPSNILIGKDGKIKISDFGISKLMSAEEQSTTRGAGTQKFMAPEILKEEKYNEKADVYSFGVVLYFILSGGEMPKINIIKMGTGLKAPIPD